MNGSGRSLADGIFYGGVIVVLVLLNLTARGDVGLMAGLRELGVGLLSVGVVAALAWAAWRLGRGPETPTARQLAGRLAGVRLMDGTQFEAFVADIFRALGYGVARIGGVGDQGVDIVLNPRGGRVAVQCKNHARPVGNEAVQEVYAGARYHGCVEAWVVAPAGYTRGAQELARSTHVALHDAGSLRAWIQKVDDLDRGRAGGPPPEEIGDPSPQPALAGSKKSESVGGVARTPNCDYPPER